MKPDITITVGVDTRDALKKIRELKQLTCKVHKKQYWRGFWLGWAIGVGVTHLGFISST